MTTTPDPSVDPADPVFISYRQSDGTEITTELAWLLRAAGIPVWRDADDLPPGDTEARLQQAMSDGLSGAVLIVTPEIEESEIVKFTESTSLIELHETNPGFALGIINAVERAPGKTDYSAPDQLLAKKQGTLSGVDQHPASRKGLLTLVKKMLWHRIQHQRSRVAENDSTYELTVQTRNAAQVYDRTEHQLDIRIRSSSHERLPSREGLVDLKDTIGLLPDAVTRSSANNVRVLGGAHLSVAFALGAALPSSRVGYMEVIDQREDTWQSTGESAPPKVKRIQVTNEGINTASLQPGRLGDRGGRAARPRVAAYLDLLPNPSASAFERFLEENGDTLAAWVHLSHATEDLLDPTSAGELAAEAASQIRALSNKHSNAEVHLMLRCPFPIAVLLGRLTNTLRFVTYEWDDSDPVAGSDYRARYVAALRVRASAVDGVITEVLLTS